MKNYILFLGIFISTISFSQDKEYAKLCLTKLTSNEFKGRGFVGNGDKIAAKFIASELKKHKISPIQKSYFQDFNIAINTYPYKSSVLINNKKLVVGKDYLIVPLSGSLLGNFNLVYFDSTVSNYENKIVIIDKKRLQNYDNQKIRKFKLLNPAKAKGFVEIVDGNLLQVQSQKEANFVWLQIKRESFDSLATSINIDVKNKYYDNYKTQNVCAIVKGEVDSFVVFSAHYDHLGAVAKEAVFAGANDNGSGVVTLLDLAKYYSQKKEKPHYSIVFLFFSAEEVGLLGSAYFTENTLIDLKKVKFLFNLDMVGSGETGIAIVNGKSYPKEMNILKEINTKNNYFEDLKIRENSTNSDHYYFTEKGVSSVFVYTEGNYKEYHSIYDNNVEALLTRYNELFNLLTQFVEKIK